MRSLFVCPKLFGLYFRTEVFNQIAFLFYKNENTVIKLFFSLIFYTTLIK